MIRLDRPFTATEVPIFGHTRPMRLVHLSLLILLQSAAHWETGHGASDRIPGYERVAHSPDPYTSNAHVGQPRTGAAVGSSSTSSLSSGQGPDARKSSLAYGLGVNLETHHAAAVSNLSCFSCMTIAANEKCTIENETLTRHFALTNHPRLDIPTQDCPADHYFCSVMSVNRIEYHNDEYFERFWALERSCTKDCKPGCITMGERTKIKLCAECCTTDFCNTGSSGDAVRPHWPPLPLLLSLSLAAHILSLTFRHLHSPK